MSKSELYFFLNNYTEDQTGGGDKNNDNIEPKNIDIIKAYRKKNRQLYKRIEELEKKNNELEEENNELEEENKKLKDQLGKIY